MDWIDIYWDAEIEAHVAANGLTREDVANAVCNPTDEDTSDGSGRPIRFGLALDGRKIMVAFEWIDDISILPVTAYEVK